MRDKLAESSRLVGVQTQHPNTDQTRWWYQAWTVNGEQVKQVDFGIMYRADLRLLKWPEEEFVRCYRVTTGVMVEIFFRDGVEGIEHIGAGRRFTLDMVRAVANI